MRWLFNIISSNTVVASDLSTQQCSTDDNFWDYKYTHCDIINFSISTSQIEFWCVRDADYTDEKVQAWKGGRMRSCYSLDYPHVGILRRIWELNADSHKCIKEYLYKNKPIPSNSDSDMVWAYSIILGGREE